jgi:3-deoxy-D-manno-octulosonate 8-phosphate phosphatase (KDO 8-P phosphatase)
LPPSAISRFPSSQIAAQSSNLKEPAVASPTTKKIPAALAKRARQIKVFLMDVDGTITDGSVTLLSQPDGTALEIKTFDAHDGQGLTLAHTAGIRTGVITGRGSAALRRRCTELGIEFVYEKQPHKIAAFEEILKKSGAKEFEVAYLGDDLPDLTVMRRVGFAVAVGDAAPEVKNAAHFVTKAIGGKGAAREVVEVILKSRGIWADMIDKARA